MLDQDRRDRADAPTTAWGEAYRRVVEVHYALAVAGRVDEDLHHWCLDKLNELLQFIDETEHRERAETRRAGGDETAS